MTKQEEALELLQALRGANISYKEFARVTGINVNSLYAWIERKNLTEKKAEYIINAVKHYFSEEYEIITINKKHREALLRGDDYFDYSLFQNPKTYPQ
jgi:predicted transcriptional regulator